MLEKRGHMVILEAEGFSIRGQSSPCLVKLYHLLASLSHGTINPCSNHNRQIKSYVLY